MEILIGSFQMVKVLPTKYLPISVAIWDPNWYHNFKANNIFMDERGLMLGYRCEELSPAALNTNACNTCNGKFKAPDCTFISLYRQYLDSLNFTHIYELLTQKVKQSIYSQDICLLVHEGPNNNCSERHSIKEWFKNNGISIEDAEGKFDTTAWDFWKEKLFV